MKNGLKILFFAGLCCVSANLLGMRSSIEEKVKTLIEGEEKGDQRITPIQYTINFLDAGKMVNPLSSLAIIIDKAVALKQQGQLQDVENERIEKLIDSYVESSKAQVQWWKHQLEQTKK
jgi:hypothetical protein